VRVVHGGTDSLPPPRFDFSTNANALGPSPPILTAVRRADPSVYPDPAYTALRARIAARHGVSPGEVVVGAGASELIQRIVRGFPGSVLTLRTTFGEYAAAAAAEGRPVRRVDDLDTMADLASRAGVVFVCAPNNPTGEVPTAGQLAAVRAAAPPPVPCVLDLAYAPLSRVPVPPVPGWWTLHSPTKAHGVTGIRAAYLLADPAGAARLDDLAASWIVSTGGVAFLDAATGGEAEAWVAATAPILWGWRELLAGRLAALGAEVREGAANFLVAGLADAGIAERLRTRHGIAVRDATSLGLPGMIRLSAQPPPAVDALSDALTDALGDAHGKGTG